MIKIRRFQHVPLASPEASDHGMPRLRKGMLCLLLQHVVTQTQKTHMEHVCVHLPECRC